MDGRIGIAQKSPIVPAGDSGIPTVELPGGTHHVEKKRNKANPPSGNDAAKKTRRDPASSSENRTDPADLEILEESREMVEAQLKFCNAYSTMADFRLAHYDYTMEFFVGIILRKGPMRCVKNSKKHNKKREFLLKNRDILFKKLQEQEFAVTADKIDAYVVKRMVDAGYKGTPITIDREEQLEPFLTWCSGLGLDDVSLTLLTWCSGLGLDDVSLTPL